LRAALVVALVAGVLVGTIWVGGDRLLSNFEHATSEVAADANTARAGASRNDIWRATLKLFAAHPILGAGLGGYWIAITQYHDASGTLTPQEAHNDYLELLASGGVVGFALGIWFFVSVVRSARKSLWTSSGSLRAVRLGAILGLAGVGVHSLVDFGLHLMGNAVVFLALIMMATATLEARKVIDLNLQQQ
jgi:O-antigen ligase